MTRYADHVKDIESGVRDFGFHSDAGLLLDGEPAFKRYSDMWSRDSEGEAKLTGRSPAHLDRDRVLYSDAFRAQDDKYHTLYYGTARRSRNYTTHSLRAAHIGRTTAQRLGLNTELTEAIILAAKVGSVPFVHRGRTQVANWIQKQVQEMDKHATDKDQSAGDNPLFTYDASAQEMILPDWISTISSPKLRAEVRGLIPWAEGAETAPAYHSGTESYWTLTTNSYLRSSTDKGYLSQTMYGAWRHSLNTRDAQSSRFSHSILLDNGATQRKLTQDHCTHEAALSRYCDDITWVLENLNEAARVSALNGVRTVYSQLANRYGDEFDPIVSAALGSSDSGKLYTYFIDDLVTTSKHRMKDSDSKQRASETDPIIALSVRADRTLGNMKSFLGAEVFSDPRVLFRNQTIDVILFNTLDLLYKSWDHDKVLWNLIEQRARAEGWDSNEDIEAAKKLLPHPVHRIQITVDLLTSMSDREVFELIGINS